MMPSTPDRLRVRAWCAPGYPHLESRMDRRAWLDLNLDLSTADGPALDRQRLALDACLNDPRPEDDVDTLIARAGEVMAALDTWNSRVEARQQARARLSSAQVRASAPAAPANASRGTAVLDGRPGQGGDGDGEEDPETQEARRLITAAYAARTVVRAPGLQHYAGGRVHVHVPGHTIESRATFTSANFPSAATRLPGILQPSPDQPTSLLDLIDRQTMNSQVIEWVQEVGYPNAAAFVAEGGLKPESTLSFELRNTAAGTIAHFVNITRQALEDEAQIDGYIRGRMTYGLRRNLNTQVLTGNGTAPNLRGILNTTGLGAYVAPADEDPLVSVRKARTVAELSGYAPDGVVMNPVDWERIELSQTTTGEFRVAPTVANGAAARLWGLTVIVTVNITGSTGGVGGGGRFLVGSFREGVTLWERTGIDFYVTDSHASNFTSNILTMLCEMRAALTVWRPAAIVAGTFDDGV